jgi:quercetin dioxygenase-like cupin family protein
VRIPPGVCHGLSGNPSDPLKAIVFVTPTVERDDHELASEDVPGTLGTAYRIDVTSAAALGPLAPLPSSVVVRRRLHESKQSTVQIAAVRRDRIPDHKHEHHDETVFVFAQAGFGFLRLDGVIHIVQAGSIAHVPAGTVHSFEHQAEGHTRALSIFTPNHDGKDVVLVEEKGELTPPPGNHRAGDVAPPRPPR